jgi:hypothetical protein
MREVSGDGDEKRTGVVGEIEPFDPAPSIIAAADALEGMRTPYALIGGLALDAYGIPRATKDADFAVPVGAAEEAAQRLAAQGAVVRPLRIGGVGIRDEGRKLRIDLIDRRFHFARLFEEAIQHAAEHGSRARISGREFPVVSLEHLLAMKLVSGEPKDDIDARRILQLEALDYRDARAIVERHLGPASANRLDAMARELGRPEVSARRLYKNGDPED